MAVIPIGIDCGVAETLNKYNFRNSALPFDWAVTYKGVHHIIKNDFIDFIPTKNIYEYNGEYITYNKYNVKFVHDKFNDDDILKYNRRILRFNQLLSCDNNQPVFFIKKGHSYHHHGEYDFIDDILDVSLLNDVLISKYPSLNFKIIVSLLCKFCYQNKTFDNIHPNIIIINKPILDIRDDLIHNKIISGQHFDQVFYKYIIPIITPISSS